MARFKKLGMYKHGMYETPLYHKWENMKQRCFNTKHPSYKNYGGRGITVCDEWKTFLNYYEWAIHNNYSDDLELDRIDNNGNYEPSNCRFISHKANNNNKRTNKYYTYNEKEYLLNDLAKLVNINPNTLRTRLFKGWSLEQSINEPIRKGGRYNDQYYTRNKQNRDA